MRNQKGLARNLILIVIALFVLGLYFIYQKQQKISSSSVEISGYSPSSIPQSQSKLDTISNEWKEYFKSKILFKYPEFQKLIDKNDIKRVFPIILKGDNQYEERNNWIIEVDEFSNLTHYYITPTLQRKLINATTTSNPSGEYNGVIADIYTVGNEQGLGRSLQDPEGYLILDSVCYGYGTEWCTSVYKLSTGEKISLVGWDGVYKNGNAKGKVRGIYGINNPTLVVDDGSFNSAATIVEEISSTAYFDLQSGQLKTIIKFN